MAERNHAIDIIKTIAILGVITIHVSAVGYSGSAVTSLNWCATLFWGSITRASVPLFLMCSGALLLDPAKPLTIERLYKKNLLRILLALFVWATAYQIYRTVSAGEISRDTICDAIKNIVLFRHEFHLYYLHIMLLVYAFLPLTRVFVKHASPKEMRYVIGVWFVLGILFPTFRMVWPLDLFSGVVTEWPLNLAYASIGYGIAGYYIQTHATLPRKSYVWMGMIGFVVVFGGTFALSLEKGSLVQTLLQGASLGVALMALGLFGYICTRCKTGRGGNVHPWITVISKASFCIYLAHVFFIDALRYFGLDVGCLPSAVSIPLVVTANFCLSMGLYSLLSKSEVIRKYLI